MLASLAATLAAAASAAGAEDFAAGNSLYGAGDYTGAREAYARCLKLAPARTDCKTNLASVLLDLDPQHEALAETLYRQVLQAQPDHGDAAFNLALILQGRKHEDATAEAAKHYQTAVAADPDRWDAWANLANALAEDGRRGLAIRAYQRAILLIEQMQQAGGGGGERGGRRRRRHRGARARRVPRQAVLRLRRRARVDDGERVRRARRRRRRPPRRAGRPRAPRRRRLRRKRAERPAHHRRPRPVAPVGGAHARRADGGRRRRTRRLAHARLARLRQGSLRRLFRFVRLETRQARARNSRRAILGAQFSARAILGAQSSDDAPPPARRSLGYRVPELVGAAAAAVVRDARGGRPFSAALDAGCGTGLAGPYLRPLVAGALIGVDISPKMLELAANLRADGAAAAPPAGSTAVGAAGGAAPVALYDRLLAKDLLALRRDDVGGLDAEGAHAIGTGPLELVVAADVLVYFGALDELLRTFAGLSAAGASLIFSCERAPRAPTRPPAGG